MALSGAMQYWINLIGVAYDHLFPIAAEAELLGFAGLALADHLADASSVDHSQSRRHRERDLERSGGVRRGDRVDGRGVRECGELVSNARQAH